MNGIGFSYEIIRDYLIKEGGKVEYHKLIKHFKDALANPENKEARVLFKDLVNQVAIVTTEGNQKFLSLRTNLIEQPPKLPPRSTSHTDNQLNYNDSRINLNYPTTSNYQQSTANQYYDTQNKSSQSQLNQITQQSNKYMNQQFNHLQQQQNYNQQRIHSNIDLTMNMMNNQLNNQINNHQYNSINNNQNKNQFNILDTQPRQPFSYNLNQPIPAILNQRIHPAEMNNANNLDLNNVLIQPKPVPQIQQMPINNLMNVNLVNRYSNKSNIDNQPNPPLPAKNMWSNQANNEPPKAPPRRKSFASSSNTYLNKKSTTINSVKDNENFTHSSPKQFTDKLKEINELKFNSPGRVKEHAKKLNKMVSESELKLPMPLGNNNSTNIQNNQKDDTDLTDQIKRRWMVNSSCCDYNELQQMLKDYPKLAEFKDISSGWTAIHWAAKFNKPDIIKLIAGTHNVNPNIKTFSGYTPIHIAALFDNKEIIELLTKGYDADPSIRDHTGRTAEEILRINRNKNRVKPAENGLSRKNEQETGKGFLARTASLRQTHKLLDRLPSKYRTNPK